MSGAASSRQLAVARALAYERALGGLGEAFASRGLAPVVVKGQAVADLVYGDEPRPAADIDLLVGDEADGIAGVLAELGYREHSSAGRRFSSSYLGERRFIPGDARGVGVELHRDLDKQVKRPIDYRGILVRARPSARTGLRFPAPEDLLLIVVLHASVADGLDPARPLADLHRLISRAELDWAVIGERARAWRLERALSYWLHAAASSTGAVAPRMPRRRGAAITGRISSWSRRLAVPGGVRHFVDQLQWHDGPWPVLRAATHYTGLRLLDRLGEYLAR